MTTRENNLLLQFMEKVYPKDLLRDFELTGFREETVLEKDRFGVESGELIVSLEERDCFRNPVEGHTYRPNGLYEASKVRDFLQLGTPCEIVAKLRACLWRRLLRCFAIRLRLPRSSLFRKLRTRPSAG